MTERVVARLHHVIGRDRAADLRRGALDESAPSFDDRCSRMKRNSGKLLDPFRQIALDEHLLAVEDVDVRIGHLAVHQERHVDLFHALQTRMTLL